MNISCLHIRPIVISVVTGILTFTTCLKANDASRDEKQQTPKEVFNCIRRAWQQADSKRLMDYIGDVKIIISFENERLESGLYSRNQAYYLFDTLFKKTKTTDFTFVKIIEDQEQNNSPHAFASHTYRRRGDDSQKHEQIYIALMQINQRWFITHIIAIEKPKM